MDKKLYLKPNVIIEPMADRWYAWSHLVPLAAAAMDIMRASFSDHRTLFDSAVHPGQCVPESEAGARLLYGFRQRPDRRNNGGGKRSHQKPEKVVSFTKAIKDVDKLQTLDTRRYNPKGINPKIPERPGGCVESYYHRTINPNFLFFDLLMYPGAFYNKAPGSLICGSHTNGVV